MRGMPAKLFALCVIAMFASGCATTDQSATQTSKYMTDAVMQSFADIFDGSWSGVTVYVQKNAWMPDDLKNVGQNPARTTTVDELMRQADDLEKAPAMASVTASIDNRNIIHVRVDYQPVIMKGLEPETRGGSFEYGYKVVDGKLVMLTRTKSIR